MDIASRHPASQIAGFTEQYSNIGTVTLGNNGLKLRRWRVFQIYQILTNDIVRCLKSAGRCGGKYNFLWWVFFSGVGRLAKKSDRSDQIK